MHLASGAWGVLAVGLLHPQQGLLYSGSAQLLASQAIGVVYLTLMAAATSLPMLLLLRELDVLRVAVEVEARGLDCKFGISALVHDSEKLLHLKEVSAVIQNYGFDVDELISSLEAIRENIVLPFSPHASDKQLEGQVEDILERFDWSFTETFPEASPASDSFSFSRSQTRSRREGASYNQAEMANSRNSPHPSGHAPPNIPRLEIDPEPEVSGLKWRDIGILPPIRGVQLEHDELAEALETQVTFSQTEWDAFEITNLEIDHYIKAGGVYYKPTEMPVPVKYAAFLSHHKRDAGGEARIFVDTARRLVYGESRDNSRTRRKSSLMLEPTSNHMVLQHGVADSSHQPAPSAAEPSHHLGLAAMITRTPPSMRPSEVLGLGQPSPSQGDKTSSSGHSFARRHRLLPSKVPFFHPHGFGSSRSIFGDDATSELEDSRGGGGEEVELAPRSETLEAAVPKLLAHIPRERFVFLDSSNLTNISKLMTHVKESSVFLLLLTRETLKRPAVLAELCCAHAASGKQVIPIKVEWPEAVRNGRDFRFPRDLDEAIYEWTLFLETRRRQDEKIWALGGHSLKVASLRSPGASSSGRSRSKRAALDSSWGGRLMRAGERLGRVVRFVISHLIIGLHLLVNALVSLPISALSYVMALFERCCPRTPVVENKARIRWKEAYSKLLEV